LYDETAAPAVTPASARHGKRRLVSTLLVSSEGAHKLVEAISRSTAIGGHRRYGTSTSPPDDAGVTFFSSICHISLSYPVI
jgi:hypothetical protein